MSLEYLSIKEMLREVSEYCEKQDCPKLSEEKDAHCLVNKFCTQPILSPLGNNNSRIPDIKGMDLEVAYEIITKER